MRNFIVLTLFSVLTPLSVNSLFNDDNRVYSINQSTIAKASIASFHDAYELSTAEIVVDSTQKIQAAPIKEEVIKPAMELAFTKPRASKKFGKFANFRSSFKEIANYWPSKANNPISKKEVKLEKLVKLEIPSPVLVKKIDLNQQAIAEIDKKFEHAFANENDFITTTKEVQGKVIEVKISLLTMDLQNHIKGGEAIASMPLPRLAVENFKEEHMNQKLAFLDEDEELDRLITAYKKDKVKISQSSVKKEAASSNKDDLVFIDLDDKKVTPKIVEKQSGPIEPTTENIDKKRTLAAKLALDEILTSQKAEKEVQASPTRVGAPGIISKSVTDAITRSMKQVSSKRSDLLAALGKKFAAKPRDISKFLPAQAIAQAEPKPEMVNAKPYVVMTPLLIDLDNKKKPLSLHEFDVIPSFDLNDVITDAGTGKIRIEYPLFTEKGLFHGSLVHRDTVRVNFDLPIGSEENEYSIPAFDLSQFNEFLNKNKVSVPGGFLLVEYSEGIESVDIENYQHVLHLDNNFKVIDEKSLPDYSLFVGVGPGNTLLRALNNKGEISEKVLFIYDDELTFTNTHYESSKKFKFNLYKENLLGKKSVLSLDSTSVSYFNLPIKSERHTVNGYSLKAPPLMEGMRRYLEVKTDSGVFIIGTDKGGDLSVPTEKTLDFYLGEVNLSDFENSCIVQLNTNKPIDSMQVDGITKRGPMLLDSYYLNDDGQLYKNIDGVVRKIFITGDYQGTIYFNLKYVDGTEEVAKTYCSPGTYVIENF